MATLSPGKFYGKTRGKFRIFSIVKQHLLWENVDWQCVSAIQGGIGCNHCAVNGNWYLSVFFHDVAYMLDIRTESQYFNWHFSVFAPPLKYSSKG